MKGEMVMSTTYSLGMACDVLNNGDRKLFRCHNKYNNGEYSYV